MNKKSLSFFNIAIIVVLSGFLLLVVGSCVIGFCDRNSTYLKGKAYTCIEELHADLVDTMNRDASESVDYWVRDLVAYFDIDDLTVIVSTYSGRKSGDVEKDSLFIQFAKKEAGAYHLITPIEGYGQFAELKIGEDYQTGGNYRYYATVLLNGKKQSICFLYKSADDVRSLYFDGNKTTELLISNPFEEGSFTFCYAKSKPDSFWNKISSPVSERHIVELKLSDR